MNASRVLVAGVGNIFLGDDAFGVAVVQRLGRCGLPEEVRVVDFGIRMIDLTYALLDGYEAVVLVDAVPRGGAPGTLYILEPNVEPSGGAEAGCLLVEGHGMDPVKVLRLAASMGGQVGRMLVVGCEPTPADDDDMHSDMSAAVRAAVDEAVVLVESLVGRLLRGEAVGAG